MSKLMFFIVICLLVMICLRKVSHFAWNKEMFAAYFLYLFGVSQKMPTFVTNWRKHPHLYNNTDMRTTFFRTTIPALVIVLALAACKWRMDRPQMVTASDKMATRETPLNEFTQLTTIGSHDLVYIQERDGGHPRVVIEGPENIVELMKVDQDGNDVTISLKKGVNVRMNHKTLVVRAYSGKLNALSLVGSGNAKVEKALDTDGMILHLTGSGHINVQPIHCEGEYTASVSGSGGIDMVAVDGEKCDFSVSGSGRINIHGIVSRQVSANVTGSGRVMLDGEADEASLVVTGSGKIEASGLKSGKVSKSTTGSGRIIL